MTGLTEPTVLVFMGVAGSGKSTVAAFVAARLGWRFEEGDVMHPPANVARMAAGRPLTDDDRRPWLAHIADWIDERLDGGENGLITCSALKRSYRDLLNRRGSGVVFVYLAGSRETIAERLAARHGHFMPPRLLESQFADLQEPAPDEPAIRIDVTRPAAVLADEIIARLQQCPTRR